MGAPGTWTGVISDSLCAATHETGGEGGLPETEHECTIACVRGGSKYVLVADGQVYAIAAQDDPALAEHAGTKVRVTGELKDGVLTIAAIAPEP
jgi:hypothetical protein